MSTSSQVNSIIITTIFYQEDIWIGNSGKLDLGCLARFHVDNKTINMIKWPSASKGLNYRVLKILISVYNNVAE